MNQQDTTNSPKARKISYQGVADKAAKTESTLTRSSARCRPKTMPVSNISPRTGGKYFRIRLGKGKGKSVSKEVLLLKKKNQKDFFIREHGWWRRQRLSVG
jgi:hypothetical protein